MFPVLLLTSCTGDGRDRWQRFEGLDAGGFTVSMPVKPDLQHGQLVLGSDTVETHVDIVADSGVVYVAAWFDTPAGIGALPVQAGSDSVWAMVKSPLGVAKDREEAAFSAAASARSGWFVNNKGTRVGLVVHRMDDRIIILNASAPDGVVGAVERMRMERFLRSFEPRR